MEFVRLKYLELYYIIVTKINQLGLNNYSNSQQVLITVVAVIIIVTDYNRMSLLIR